VLTVPYRTTSVQAQLAVARTALSPGPCTGYSLPGVRQDHAEDRTERLPIRMLNASRRQLVLSSVMRTGSMAPYANGGMPMRVIFSRPCLTPETREHWVRELVRKRLSACESSSCGAARGSPRCPEPGMPETSSLGKGNQAGGSACGTRIR